MTERKTPAKAAKTTKPRKTSTASKPKTSAKTAAKPRKKAATKKPSLKAIEKKILDNAKAAATVCDERRANDIRVLDVRGLCAYADALVIATAASLPQMKGLVKAIERDLHERGVKVRSRNGLDSGAWVLLDCGDFLMHLFNEETREYYQIEEMYGDAPQLPFTAASRAQKKDAEPKPPASASTRQRLKISRATQSVAFEIIDVDDNELNEEE